MGHGIKKFVMLKWSLNSMLQLYFMVFFRFGAKAWSAKFGSTRQKVGSKRNGVLLWANLRWRFSLKRNVSYNGLQRKTLDWSVETFKKSRRLTFYKRIFCFWFQAFEVKMSKEDIEVEHRRGKWKSIKRAGTSVCSYLMLLEAFRNSQS